MKSGYVKRLGPVDNYQCLQRLVGKLMPHTLVDVFDAKIILSRLKNKHNHHGPISISLLFNPCSVR